MQNDKQNIFLGAIGLAILVVLIGGFSFLNTNLSTDSSSAKSGTEEANTIESDTDIPQQGRPQNEGGPPSGGRGRMSEEEQLAIENKDYTAWLEAVGDDNPILEFVTSEELFLKFTEMEEAIQNQNMEAADEIREELGFPQMGGETQGERLPPNNDI